MFMYNICLYITFECDLYYTTVLCKFLDVSYLNAVYFI